MKFTLSWLKDHLETDAPLGEIVETLTRIGLEVEGLDDPAARLAGFTIARVIEAKPHPNADRLRVCSVDTGQGGAPVQVVCGAPNARTGMRSVFSPPGTFIPGKKITLGAGVIRGVELNGMLCSEAELELSEDHDGIIDLPEDAPVGTSYAAYAGLDDPVIDINLTPNRPDAASVYGIARDLAAAGLGRLKAEPVPAVQGAFPCPVAVRLDLAPADEHLCPAFGLRLVRGVKNGPSPEWMRRRLAAIGLRPINALVDITNFMTFDRGRPLHVFDAAKVHGALAVRRARAGEQLTGLNGKNYALDDSMVVIADQQGPESLAGIMGGRKLRLRREYDRRSDRERPLGPDRHRANRAQARHQHRRALSLRARCRPRLLSARTGSCDRNSCSTSAAASLRLSTLAGTLPVPDLRVDFPLSEVVRLTGLELPASDAQRILERLGFDLLGHPDNSDWVVAKVPSWRPDIHGKADLVEEILRIAGLDKVVSQPLDRDPRCSPSRADAASEADAIGEADARRMWPSRSRHLVVRVRGPGQGFRRRGARTRHWPTRSPPSFRPCGRASCRD